MALCLLSMLLANAGGSTTMISYDFVCCLKNVGTSETVETCFSASKPLDCKFSLYCSIANAEESTLSTLAAPPLMA